METASVRIEAKSNTPPPSKVQEDYHALATGVAIGFPTVAEGLRVRGTFLGSFAGALEHEAARARNIKTPPVNLSRIEQIVANEEVQLLPAEKMDLLREHFLLGLPRRPQLKQKNWHDETQTILKFVREEHAAVAEQHAAEVSAGKKLETYEASDPDLQPSEKAKQALEDHKTTEEAIQQQTLRFLRDNAVKNPDAYPELAAEFQEQQKLQSKLQKIITSGNVDFAEMQHLRETYAAEENSSSWAEDAYILAAVGEDSEALKTLSATLESIERPSFVWKRLAAKELIPQALLQNVEEVKTLSDLVQTAKSLADEPKSVQTRILKPFLHKGISATMLRELIDGNMTFPDDFLEAQVDALVHFNDTYEHTQQNLKHGGKLVATALTGMAIIWALNSPVGQPVRDTAQNLYEQAKTTLLQQDQPDTTPTPEEKTPTEVPITQERPSSLSDFLNKDTTGRMNVGGNQRHSSLSDFLNKSTTSRVDAGGDAQEYSVSGGSGGTGPGLDGNEEDGTGHKTGAANTGIGDEKSTENVFAENQTEAAEDGGLQQGGQKMGMSEDAGGNGASDTGTEVQKSTETPTPEKKDQTKTDAQAEKGTSPGQSSTDAPNTSGSYKPENSSAESNEQAKHDVDWEIIGNSSSGYYRIDSGSRFDENITWESNNDGSYLTPHKADIATSLTIEGDKEITGSTYEVPIRYGYSLSQEGVTITGDDVSWKIVQSPDGNMAIQFADSDVGVGKHVTIDIHLGQTNEALPQPSPTELKEMSTQIVSIDSLPQDTQDYIAKLQADPTLSLEQKALLLTSYIRSTFTYSFDQDANAYYLAAGADGNEYVKRVFEVRKTDCDVANTALAALLRANGIPSRMAFGFNNDGDGRLTGNEMHGWVEAFLPDGNGSGKWIVLDGTPTQMDSTTVPQAFEPTGGGNIDTKTGKSGETTSEQNDEETTSTFMETLETFKNLLKDPNLADPASDITKLLLASLVNAAAIYGASRVRRSTNKNLAGFRRELLRRHQEYFKTAYRRLRRDDGGMIYDELQSLRPIQQTAQEKIFTAIVPIGGYVALAKAIRTNSNRTAKIPYSDETTGGNIVPAEEPNMLEFFSEVLGYNEGEIRWQMQEKAYNEAKGVVWDETVGVMRRTLDGVNNKDYEPQLYQALKGTIPQEHEDTTVFQERLQATISEAYSEYQKAFAREKKSFDLRNRLRRTKEEYTYSETPFDAFRTMCITTHRNAMMLREMEAGYNQARSQHMEGTQIEVPAATITP